MIAYLLEKGAKIGDAHLFAIKKGFPAAVEALLEALKSQDNGESINEYAAVKHSVRFQPDMTPLMVACTSGQVTIARLLKHRKHELKEIDPPNCGCEKCLVIDKLDLCIRRFNYYRSVGSPTFVHCYVFNPFTHLLYHSRKSFTEALDFKDPFIEHNKEIVKNMETYCLQLIGNCRTTSEVSLVHKQDMVTDGSEQFIAYPVILDNKYNKI